MRFGATTLLGAALLAGCATTPPPPASPPAVVRPAAAQAAPTRVRPSRTPSRLATPQLVPGVEGVIGADAAGLIRQFGPPRLDIVEGDARKLQWSGAACVLDAYLYPPAEGGEPLATYLDARRPSDAQDVDRAACIAALRAR
ncbi:MAG: hypothetical protein LC648_04740 [Novosphingobium sp.]|nr:hypothetical protein [Novosphingobium sp.]